MRGRMGNDKFCQKRCQIYVNFNSIQTYFPRIRNTSFSEFNIDGFVKSLKSPFDVIPAKAGIQYFQIVLDACLRRHDGVSDFLRVCQYSIILKNLSEGYILEKPQHLQQG